MATVGGARAFELVGLPFKLRDLWRDKYSLSEMKQLERVGRQPDVNEPSISISVHLCVCCSKVMCSML